MPNNPGAEQLKQVVFHTSTEHPLETGFEQGLRYALAYPAEAHQLRLLLDSDETQDLELVDSLYESWSKTGGR